jgi:hypothetical protein
LKKRWKNLKKQILNVKARINKFDKNVNEIFQGMRWYVISLAKDMGACFRVTEHLAGGEEECPISFFCQECPKNKKCHFAKSYKGIVHPRNATECHVELYNKWVLLKILVNILDYIKEIREEVSKLEG